MQIPQLPPLVPITSRPAAPAGGTLAEHEGGVPPAQPSFRELVRLYAPFVGRIAADAGVPAGDVDDVAQAVLLLLWHQLRRGPIEHVRAWLGTVARRSAWAHNRALKAQSELPKGYLALQEKREAPSAEVIFEAMVAIRLVHEVVAQLAPARRVVFVRHELDGETMGEIAADLGIPVSTGHSRLYRAREDFRRLLRARMRRDEGRRRFVLWPFLLQQNEARPSAGSWVCAAVLLLVVLAILMPDTPLSVVVASQAATAMKTASVAASAAEPLERPADRPETTAATAVPRATSAAAPARPAKHEDPAHSPRPRRRGNLETERILLDTADRMAAEGQADTARETLQLYGIHAPDDPLPATRASAEAQVNARPPAAPKRFPQAPAPSR